ncbi:MAG TPA: PH domain-containing protein [Nocardioides sp.]|uniref:PH domain-containing protein n=1 Tax=Nocardioides sp. TaxID=35761 RepID=UPI002E30852F|nr:PH domain-containing protein [Nocardioides sp.]HEX5087027.1 PH domain-containing protein [Nocardioides sp.]
MPADSEPSADLPPLPRTWRPLGPRVVGIAVTFALVAVVAAGWFGFDPEDRARFTWFQRGTLIFFGLLYLALMFALIRSRAVAYADRLVVVNGYRRHEFAWPQIVAARLPPGAPWVTLDLADGETASVMGIQGSDGARARTALRELKALVEAGSAP